MTTQVQGLDELKAKVGEHARKKHNVQGMTDTIYAYIRDTARS